MTTLPSFNDSSQWKSTLVVDARVAANGETGGLPQMARRLMFLVFLGIVLAGTSAAQDIVLPSSSLRVDRVIPLSELEQNHVGAIRTGGGTQINAVDPNAIYSNITNFLGSAFTQGAAASGITRLVMDDVTFTTSAGVGDVTAVRFSVANLNGVAHSVRARLRFWNADGADLGGGLLGPGTYYNGIGFTFNPFTFAPGVTVITGGLGAGSFAVPAGTTTTLWAGITFDNVGTTTGATETQLNNFGQGLFNPVNLGSSQDALFETTAAGSFLSTNSPAGAKVDFGGAPVANTGWELVVGVVPVELSKFTID